MEEVDRSEELLEEVGRSSGGSWRTVAAVAEEEEEVEEEEAAAEAELKRQKYAAVLWTREAAG